MKAFIIRITSMVFWLFSFSPLVFAGPWFTGPILAPAGHTIPRGHVNLEVYGLGAFSDGFYDDSGNIIHTPLYKSIVPNPILTYGLSERLDVQVALPYSLTTTRDINYNRISDISTALGYQITEQKGSPQRADFRLILQETFPTGKFDQLNPAFLGTDATGLGSYRSQVGLDFQYLKEVFKDHYLRTRFIFYQVYYSSVHVFGLNAYGGTVNTEGSIAPGYEADFDLAFEYTLTQHWVAVMEATYSTGSSTVFNGLLDLSNLGRASNTRLLGGYNVTTIAPAIEYNFNANVGLIGGVWLPVQGRNSSYFKTYVLALNAYW